MKIKQVLATTILVSGLTFAAQAADKAAYQSNMQEVVTAIVSGQTSDIDALITKLETATDIGVEMAKEVAAADPEGAKLLNFMVQHLDKIKSADLETIESEFR